MNRVLLVFEDYSEMNDIQFALRKTGFDVVSIGSEFSITEEILSFNPDIVIGSGKGPKVTTVGVGRRLKEMPRWHGKVVLIFPAGYKPNAQDLLRVRMDMILEAPIESSRMLQVMAKLTDQDANELLDKLLRAVAQEKEDAEKNPNRSSGGNQDSGSQTVFVTGSKKPEEVGWAYGSSKEIDDLNKVLGGTGQERDKKQALKAKSGGSHQDDDIAGIVSSDQNLGSDANKVKSFEENVDNQNQVASGGTSENLDNLKLKSPDELRKELENAQVSSKERVSKYDQFLQGLSVGENSTLTRVEAKKRLKDLRQDWDTKKLQTLDELRREFTNALFKKK